MIIFYLIFDGKFQNYFQIPKRSSLGFKRESDATLSSGVKSSGLGTSINDSLDSTSRSSQSSREDIAFDYDAETSKMRKVRDQFKATSVKR